MFFTQPTKFIYVYSNYQRIYDEIINTGVNITFLRNLPTEEELTSMLLGVQHSVMIVDDKMIEIGQSQFMLDVFTRLAHHLNMSTFIMLQASNLGKSKYAAEIKNNAHYSVLFRSGSMGYVLRSLGSRLAEYKNLITAYKMATERKNFSYLVVNTHPRASEIERYSTDILPADGACVLFINKRTLL